MEETITVLGVKYKLDSLSDDVKRMIGLHQRWKKEGEALKLDYMKHEGACRDLARELGDMLDGKKMTSEYTSLLADDGSEIIDFKNNK